MKIKKSLQIIGIAVMLLYLPGGLMACPFCFSSATEEVLHTYYFSAILLSLLPFGVIGGIAIWIYRNGGYRDHNPHSKKTKS